MKKCSKNKSKKRNIKKIKKI
jgi:hypothetical protein